MTFAIFIVLILGLFIALLNVLPEAGALSFSFEPAIEQIVAYMNAWDYLFPIHELLTLVAIFVGFEIAIWVWHVSWRVVKFIRGHSDGA